MDLKIILFELSKIIIIQLFSDPYLTNVRRVKISKLLQYYHA